MNQKEDEFLSGEYPLSAAVRKGEISSSRDAFFKKTAHLELLTEEEARKLLED